MVDNSKVKILRNETLKNGTVVKIEIQFSCEKGNHLDDVANNNFSCVYGAVWKPANPPSCLKGT